MFRPQLLAAEPWCPQGLSLKALAQELIGMNGQERLPSK
jgi:hypothetical protein